LGRMGALEVVLAANSRARRKAQRLRYDVFHREMKGRSSLRAWLSQRDGDDFDAACDHLLIREHRRGVFGLRHRRLVGTCRLMRQDMALVHDGFSSSLLYDLTPLLSHWPGTRFVEMGRSCFLASHRTRHSVEVLWHGIWHFMRLYNKDVLFGCVSLADTDPAGLALQMSYLHHFHRAPDDWCASALPLHAIGMNRTARNHIDMRQVMGLLPPLIKGYLRLGAFVGDGAVIDAETGTTQVLMILPLSMLNPRYVQPDDPVEP
jgi:L-ornithine Nalpha-acyltransferase